MKVWSLLFISIAVTSIAYADGNNTTTPAPVEALGLTYAPTNPIPSPPPNNMAASRPVAPPAYYNPQPMPYYPNPYMNYGYPIQQPYAYRAPAYPYTMPPPALPYNGMPRMPPPPPIKKETKPWGDTRYIWPDFYTDASGKMWDKMINAPYDMGYMPGGWRFPSFSSPDPVTVGDAVTNQLPPIVEEAGHFMHFTK